ncbi:proteinase [Parvularcula bermudensis HTCC2503]|uniref:Proteinase n=1 Tax=Parvularcula bermudensis (strain ATCC BAA-594 / HTCC2503 / KCTC 12087) TaxID=314260 RepID=E0TEA9_PARBH|nr:type 1 glutamine amidotransferase domain-containing protein [Parvularcula bermudensis]ADM09484.1 proteinase [Parvularcula bermudensis HTCC2503]
MTSIEGKTVAILATNGFEQSELFVPKQRLEEAGATVHIISPETGEIKAWDEDDWGDTIAVDRPLGDAKVAHYDALVLPGGQINPDLLRVNDDAVTFVRDFFNSKKPLAAICHAPWLLIEAEVVKGRSLTSYHSIATDVKNAGGLWTDEAVVVHEALITSRNPGDLDAFCDKIIEEIKEGRHPDRKKAA